MTDLKSRIPNNNAIIGRLMPRFKLYKYTIHTQHSNCRGKITTIVSVTERLIIVV